MFCYYTNLAAYDWISVLDLYKEIVKGTDTVLEIGASNLKKQGILLNIVKN